MIFGKVLMLANCAYQTPFKQALGYHDGIMMRENGLPSVGEKEAQKARPQEAENRSPGSEKNSSNDLTVAREELFQTQLTETQARTRQSNPDLAARQQAVLEGQRNALQERSAALEQARTKDARGKAVAEQAYAKREGETSAREQIKGFNGDAEALADYKRTVIQTLELTAIELERAHNILEANADIQTPEAERIRKAQEQVLFDAERNAAQYRGELGVITQFEKQRAKEQSLKRAQEAANAAFAAQAEYPAPLNKAA